MLVTQEDAVAKWAELNRLWMMAQLGGRRCNGEFSPEFCGLTADNPKVKSGESCNLGNFEIRR